ncbi:hypothetical protein [Chondromyces apiculatus]|uniref:Uncharacterized protein n=1 Tax=Chondromyces apiculatus DSM 436 TaxID=1192034 RepID=A0A017T354_9BACT|nr:hypothetical protein [Chondromyces apiculatus]EYF03658.1 Hypothetical protein CAP_5269 [Chondromyces apiculatus DSM 436]
MPAPEVPSASFASRFDRQASLRAGLLLALAASPLATGCLPGDTRPVPESFYVTAEPSQAVTEGFTTGDGWSITFDRLVAGVGNIDFDWEDESCLTYAEARYDRLFDFTVAGREKIGTAYGMGTCRVEFQLRSPSIDTLLGPGVSQDDVTRMRTPGSDFFATDEDVSVEVTGSATRDGVTKRFDWQFRKSYEMTDCEAEGGGFMTTVELTEAAESEMRLEVRGEELFRVADSPDADFHFQPLADADTVGNGDGTVTLEELAGADRIGEGVLGEGETPEEGTVGGVTEDPGGGILPPTNPATNTLVGLVYETLLPRVLRPMDALSCDVEDRSRR